MTPAEAENRELTRISKQLDELKRLMIVQLIAAGVQSAHLAEVLGVHPSVISRLVPVREIQKVSKKARRGAETDG